jgi:hypothetical protein
MWTCQLREKKPWQKNIDPPWLLWVGIVVVNPTQKMIYHEMRRNKINPGPTQGDRTNDDDDDVFMR